MTVFSEPVPVERQDHLTFLTLNRAKRLNALDAEASKQLGDAFEAFERDDDNWVAILAGTRRAVCTGNDLISMARGW